MRTWRVRIEYKFSFSLFLPFVLPSYYLILVLTATLRNAVERNTWRKTECAYERHTRFNANTARRKRNGRRRKRGRRERATQQKRRNRKYGRVRTYFIQLLLPCSLLLVWPFTICLRGIYTQLFLFNGFFVCFIISPNFSSCIFIIVLLRYPTVERLSRVSRAPLVHLLRFRHSLGANNRTAIP